MLNEKNMLDYFWAKAKANDVYIVNITPTTNCPWHDAWGKIYKQNPRYFAFKVFGCIAYIHVPDSKLEKCIFIGYSLQ